ncbi:DUF402 domain-containing protein [Priestia koreensis]|uniref:DUF402 domain-containing protein n=1 Tax=Priestia koreensis TaxID=284581 RepID=UPI0020411FC2|nr:DUF402 domain-containing protein [Priestia koreensis]MCM3004111.1 DUF402 domain-containing protein [Priestia koreensis]
MIKRRYGDRADWQRILERRYVQEYIDTEAFTGYVTFLHMVKAANTLTVPYGEEQIKIVDDGYMWLQQFPQGQNHTITTTFNERGEFVQSYIDICKDSSVENGIPYWDDLFLDVVMLASGTIVEVDIEELERGIIDQPLYDLAWKEQ